MEKAGGVDKVTLKSKTGNTRLDIDQVNLPKSKMQPSTDLWPNLCASYKDGKLGVELLWPDRGPLLNFTLHNALRLNCGDAVSCCVLRRIVIPTYDDNGQFQADESFCDGRFRGKLHVRSSFGAVTLVPFWTPGPHVPPFEYFDALHGINKESDEDGNGTESGYDEDEEESGVDDDQDFVRGENDEDEEEAPHGRLIQHEVTSGSLRNRQPEMSTGDQWEADLLLARRLAKEMELNPFGESMRNKAPVNRPRPANLRSSARTRSFRGSYLDK
jgi:hypothetical protein